MERRGAPTAVSSRAYIAEVNNGRAIPAADAFATAIAPLATAPVRPEVQIEEMPAPQRVAPYAAALAAEVVQPDEGDPSANGRFVVLHDPRGPEAWHGTWRVVSYARADLESELATDPLLGEVGWSWLADALEASGLASGALGGTVTRVVSESFGILDDREPTVELEIRASWTPSGDDLAEHLTMWSGVLCTIAGLPPLPEGVTALPGRRY